MTLRNVLEPMFSARWWFSWIAILCGCTIMAAGFVFFINPYNIVPGGVYGASIVMHNLFPSVQVGTFGYMFDVPLLILALILFGGSFGARTIIAALLTPGLMNIISTLAYPSKEALQALDPSQLLGGNIDLSNDLMLATVMGSVMLGVGVGLVVRNQATTGGTDIVAMILQKYAHIKFSNGVLLADAVVVLSGLLVIGFGWGRADDIATGGWMLSLYSLIAIFLSSRVIARVIDGASYDKLIFIVSENHQEELRKLIIEELDRSATYIKASGMYTGAAKEMIFLVVSRKEVRSVEHRIKDIDPQAFMVVTDAYDTYGEGFKPLPDKNDIQAA
ncbi:MAG: YitT family protein [Alistipes sp.]|nr:YitT family protein [Alistipes sp.]